MAQIGKWRITKYATNRVQVEDGWMSDQCIFYNGGIVWVNGNLRIPRKVKELAEKMAGHTGL